MRKYNVANYIRYKEDLKASMPKINLTKIILEKN